MEALLIEYAKRYGMAKAMEMLGLNTQSQNPKYAISLGNQTFDLGNMAKKAGLNQIFSHGLTKSALPFLGIGALAYGMNKAFPMSRQNKMFVDRFSVQKTGDPYGYANQLIAGSGENKDPFGINTVSMFGDYGKYQQNLYNKLSNKNNLSDFDKARLDLADEVTKSIKEDYRVNQYNDNKKSGNGGSFDSSKSGGEGAFGSYDGSRGRKDYRRGGIASL
jgi:hypothetical protein